MTPPTPRPGPAVSVRGLQLDPTCDPRDGFNPQLDLDLQPGDILAVLGDNGSGKSLLLRCLAGLYQPAALAALTVAHCDLTSASGRRAGRRALGVVFEQAALLRHLTAAQNVALPLHAQSNVPPDRAEAQAAFLLNLVGVAHEADRYPHEMSEGARRCVSLARALAGETRVLLVDEPTAALAPDKARRIEELIQALVRRGVLDAAIVLTQNVACAARLATHFILLGRRAGRFGIELARGPIAALRTHPAMRAFLQEPPPSPFHETSSPTLAEAW